MPRLNVLTHSLNGGEVSRAALNRVDVERIRLNAERQENLFPYVIGKAIMRPGTKYITDTKFGLSRLIPFTRDVSSRALLEFALNSSGNGVLRVLVDDELVTRPAVTSTITNGSFSSGGGGWTDASTGGASVTLLDGLTLSAPGQGGVAIATQEVSTSSPTVLHALRILVTRGPVQFRVGSTNGDDDYIASTTLDSGLHSLAFTPAASYWIRFASELRRDVVVDSIAVEAAGVMEIDGYWDTTSLRSLRYAQSLDIVFVTGGSRVMKIERRGTFSWSVVEYTTDDGPFTLTRTARLKLTPSVTQGNGTLTASEAFFKSGHVDALFHLTHENTDATYLLSAVGEFTKPIRVIGLNTDTYNDRTFTVVTSGTWSGSVQVQRSFDSEFSGFEDFGTPISSSTSTTFEDEDDNAIVFYRVIVAALTSGTVSVKLTYAQDGRSGVCRVITVSTDTVAEIEVLSDFSDVTATESWLEGEWSERRGFPTALTFFDGRLFFARDDRFWSSVSDNYYSFTLDVEGDSGSVQRDVATGGEFSEIHWLLPLQRLIFGTSGAEISARTSAVDEPLTPTNVTLKPASTQGVADISPVRVDSRGIFIQRSKKRLYEIIYDFESNDYASRDLMRLHEDAAIATNPDLYEDAFVEIAVQRQPETYVWAVRDDGVCMVLLYEPAEEVKGLFKMISGHVNAPDETRPNDRIVSVTVLPDEDEDEVYFVIERTSLLSGGEGAPTRAHHIEKLGKHSETLTRAYNSATGEVDITNGLFMADSYITAAADSSEDQVISGLTHLPGVAVIVIGQVVGGAFGPVTDAEGEVETYEVNDDGEITLSQVMSGTICIGRPYSGFYKSSKLAFASQEGSALLQKKIVDQLGVALLDTHLDGLLFGPDFGADNMAALPRYKDDGTLRETTDNFLRSHEESHFPFDGEWTTDSRVCLKVKSGYSATIAGIVTGIETKEKP